jgi:molybdenum cofactor cytidylyltransferase
MSVAAILLAAGASRRLGTPKQLLVWRGETLLRRTARLALEAGFRPVRVVLGAEAPRCEATLRDLDVEIVANPAWEAGMSTSLRAGLEGLAADVDAVLVLVCDQPALSLGHLESLRAAQLAHPETAVASGYAGARGIPVLFPRVFFERLERLQGDRGARSLLQGEDVLEVPFPGGEFDLDTPEDLTRLSR